ncbi:MAG TPA: hypothetical protein VFA46_10360, partial [Actinomycetes bacterium]|nr:hypothetical protein [Actinomycetes bacterium]
VANLAGGERGGGPVLRAVVRSLGESLGADAGQRLGMALCGADIGVTAAAGAVLCPAVTIVSTSAGATLGGAGAARIYDALGPDPPKTPEPAPSPGPSPAPGPEPPPRPEPAQTEPAAPRGVVPARDDADQSTGKAPGR